MEHVEVYKCWHVSKKPVVPQEPVLPSPILPEGDAVVEEGPQELVEGDVEADDRSIDSPSMDFGFLQPQVDLVADANDLFDK